MQGLADGYFVLPSTINDYLAQGGLPAVDAGHAEVTAALDQTTDRIEKLLTMGGTRSADSFHRELGTIMWEKCGMARNAEGLTEAITRLRALREEFWTNLRVPGTGDELNQSLERANRVADFIELGELMCLDALHREESCGGHFREESQTPDGEAARDDERFSYAAAWEYTGAGEPPVLHRETLEFEYVHPTQRSYA
jgi:succinate dehydrogenase / fumarate reductase flavoprotein subunit